MTTSKLTEAALNSSSLDDRLIIALRERFEQEDREVKMLGENVDALRKLTKSRSMRGCHFKITRIGLEKALHEVTTLLNRSPSQLGKNLHAQITKSINHLEVKIRQYIYTTNKRRNTGLFVSLLNKLKPKSDGKEDFANLRVKFHSHTPVFNSRNRNHEAYKDFTRKRRAETNYSYT